MEENNFDNYFKDKLSAHSEEPPPAVWEGISAGLPAGKSIWNRRFLVLLLILISLGGAAVLGYRLYEMDSRMAKLENWIKTEKPSRSEGNQKASQKSLENDASTQSRPDEENKRKDGQPTQNEGTPVFETVPESKMGSKAGAATKSKEAKSSKTVFAPDLSAKAEYDKTPKSKGEGLELDPIGSGTVVPDSDRPKKDQTSTISPAKRSIPIVKTGREMTLKFSPSPLSPIRPSAFAKAPFTAERKETDYYSKPGRTWYAYAYGMANYTHRRVLAQAEGNEALSNGLDMAENGLIRPGAGFQVSRELGKNFRIGLGVEYNQWVQEGKYEASVQASEVEVTTSSLAQIPEFSFSGSLPGSIGDNAYTSTSNENPLDAYTEIATIPESLEFDICARTQIDYLSFPVTLEYVHNFYPFTVTLGGGISLNHIIGSEYGYEISEEAPVVEVSPSRKASGSYFAFHGGIALEYAFTERMAFRLNPVYRGWMTPVFENDQIRTMPFGVAVRGGLIYRFRE